MKKLLRSLLIIFGLIVLTMGALAYWLFYDLPDPATITDQFIIPSVRITDRHGRLLYDVVDANNGRQLNLPLEQIPATLKLATIATEDRNFYTNPGVDLEGITRAFWINLRGGEVLAGGSTITQQVTRNLLLPDERGERTVKRKLRESWLAWRVAREFNKDDILAMYLNQSYYGGLAYGVEAAAQTYFGKSAAELTLAESALLAGLPQTPALYNPLVNPEAAQERQTVVLGLMLKEGYITQEEYDIATTQPLQYTTKPYPISAPHFVMMIQAALDDLYTPEQLYNSGGLIVRTTLDLDWQTHAERIVAQQLERLNHPLNGTISHNADNAALVALDPHTGDLLALVGSPNFFDDEIAGAINMAITPRQPGSALKPLIYATGMDPQRPQPFTAATMFLDVQTTFTTSKGEPYVPVNFSRSEHGPVLLREALASSLNIPAVSALHTIGLENLLPALEDFGLQTFNNPDTYDLSFALGGGEVRLLDLTRAYASFANSGRRVEPRYILDITDVQGNIFYQAEPSPQIQILDSRVAWLISDILSDNTARSLSFGPNSVLNIDRTAAVKTGTTNDFRDNWTVGYTPDLVVGVWVGNADLEPMRDVTGLSGAGPIWHNFMRRVLTGAPNRPFVRPPGLSQTEVCVLSGLLPSDACPFTRPEWFIDGTAPRTIDRLYQRIMVDQQTGLLATAATPPENLTEKLVLDLPPEAHPWARANGITLLADLEIAGGVAAAPEETAVAQSTIIQRNPIWLTAPSNNALYRFSTELPPESQKIQLEALSDLPFATVTFWIDGEMVAELDRPPYATWWSLTIGPHTVWVEATTATGETFTSEPAFFEVNEPDDNEFNPQKP